MKSLKLVDGDLSFDSSNNLEMVSGDEEFEQALEMIMQIVLGEFVLDETVGTKRDNLLAKQFDESLARSDLIEALMQENRVEEVTDITFNRDNRTRRLSVDVTVVKTDDTAVSLKGVVINAG